MTTRDDTQALALSIVQNQTNANASVINGMFTPTGAITVLQGTAAEHTESISTLTAKVAADEAAYHEFQSTTFRILSQVFPVCLTVI